MSLDRLIATATPFTLSHAAERGIPGRRVRDAARRGELRRLCRGVYVSADAEDGPRLRLLAHQLLLPPRGVLSDTTAAHVFATHLELPALLTVTVPPSTRGPMRACLRVVRSPLAAGERVSVRGIRVTSAVRTLLDVAAGPDESEALVTVDAVAHRWGWALDEARGAVRPGSRAARQVRRVLEHAEPLTESPQETRTRTALRKGGIPPPLAQHVVLDRDGGFVGRVGVAWPRLRLAVEYDGRDSHPLGLARDRERGWELQRPDWLAVHVTAERLRREDELCARVREAAALQVQRLGLGSDAEW